jgi:hypothetical protein
MNARHLLVLGLGLIAATPAAQAQNDLRKNLKDTNVAEHWIYDDITAGFAEAKATGKPLLVTFRCVP